MDFLRNFSEEIDLFDNLIKVPARKQRIRQSLICECGGTRLYSERQMVEIYFCNTCGDKIQIQKEFEKTVENTVHLDSVKSTTTAIIIKSIPGIESKDLERIINLYLIIRKHKPHRSKNRIGDIAACTMHVTPKYTKKEIARNFGIDQKFVSAGFNLISRVINNFAEFDIIHECHRNITAFITRESFQQLKFAIDINVVISIITTAAKYNVGRSIPIRTRTAGALWFYCKAHSAIASVITDRPFINAMNMQKETFMKFYKEIILAMHMTARIDGKFQNKILLRRNALRHFLESNGLAMPILRSDLTIVQLYKQKYYLDPNL